MPTIVPLSRQVLVDSALRRIQRAHQKLTVVKAALHHLACDDDCIEGELGELAGAIIRTMEEATEDLEWLDGAASNDLRRDLDALPAPGLDAQDEIRNGASVMCHKANQ